MRLAIDCFKLVKGVGKSIGIYNVALSLTQNLVIEKQRSSDENIKNCEIIVLGNDHNKEDFDIDGVHFIQINKFNPLNKVHCIIWELFAVSKVCRKLKADKVLFPRGYCALTHPIEDIVLIHDLIPFYYDEHFPGVFNKYENAYIMNRLKSSARSAKKIITISEASKADIIEYCNVNEDKITVIHNACNAINYHEEKKIVEIPYMCAITSVLPHKNAIGVLKSYEQYHKIAEKPLQLHVIGIDDSYNAVICSEARKDIIFHKFIKSNTDMYDLIHNSNMFVFLSLVEGFGLPPIEAMQLGVPVICSNRSSLPEVVGEGAVLVNPEDYTQVANEIVRLQTDILKQRTLVKAGYRNISRFSWETRAKMYWNAIFK